MKHIDDDIAAYLKEVVEEEQACDHDGTMSSFLEKMGKTDKEAFGVCVMGTEGEIHKAANADEVFPIESTSKALSLALALEDVGPEKLFKHVAKEPRGDAFHSVSALEEGNKGLPPNPMINAGAIAVTSLIEAENGEQRFQRIRDFTRRLADNPNIDYSHEMYENEGKDLNRALFYYMRAHDIVSGTEEDGLTPYMKQCALQLNCVDLARIGAVFANEGRMPGTGETLISPQTVRTVLTLMFTTGMYEDSGKFAVDVCIPAKSGIGGSILAVVPGCMGLGLIGPALDKTGNSIAGVHILRKLTKRWKLAVFR